MNTANHQRITAPRSETPNGHEEDWKPVRHFTVRPDEPRDVGRQLAALELANRTKDAWLVAQSQKLREPMSSMAAMLGLMELAHQLALVRPIHQTSSEFDEAAFRHLRRNFERLVHFFNELADLTGETRLKVDKNESAPGKNGRKPFPILET